MAGRCLVEAIVCAHNGGDVGLAEGAVSTSAMGCFSSSHFDAPEEWPPVDLMQGAVIDVRGQTVPPVFLVVCDKVFGTGHLNEDERGIYTSFEKARTTPVL